MPTILQVGGLKFYWYANDHEPIHVHVKYAERGAKIELGTMEITHIKGFSGKDLTKIVKIIRQNEEFIREQWKEFFYDND